MKKQQNPLPPKDVLKLPPPPAPPKRRDKIIVKYIIKKGEQNEHF